MFIKLPVVSEVDSRSMTPKVLAPLPIVVAVLLMRANDGAVFEVSVMSNLPVGALVPMPTLPAVGWRRT